MKIFANFFLLFQVFIQFLAMDIFFENHKGKIEEYSRKNTVFDWQGQLLFDVFASRKIFLKLYGCKNLDEFAQNYRRSGKLRGREDLFFRKKLLDHINPDDRIKLLILAVSGEYDECILAIPYKTKHEILKMPRARFVYNNKHFRVDMLIASLIKVFVV